MFTLLRNDHLTFGSGGLGRYQVREVEESGSLRSRVSAPPLPKVS